VTASVKIPNIQSLEEKFSSDRTANANATILDIISYYAFINPTKAKILIQENKSKFENTHDTDLEINFLYYSAIIENQDYAYENALVLFEKGISLAEKLGNNKQKINLYIDISGTLMNLKRYKDAIEYIEKAKKIIEFTPDDTLLARTTTREGLLHLYFNDLDKATDLLLLSERIFLHSNKALELKEYYVLTMVYSALGNIYEITEDRERCAKAYQKVVNMCERINMLSRMSWHYLNLGKAYMSLNEFENAVNYFKKVSEIADDNNKESRALAIAHIGYCCYLKNDIHKASQLYALAESQYLANPNTSNKNLGTMYHWKGLLAAKEGKIEEAQNQFVKALELFTIHKDHKNQAIVAKDIAFIYANQNDYQKAYEYQLLHDKSSKLNFEEMGKRKVLELEIKYDTENKKKQAEMLRLQATGLQLKALRAQINPHFMFNALSSIQRFISTNNSTDAEKYLSKFAQLMRTSLEYSELEVISLEKEITFLEQYMEINQKLRFDQLQSEIIIDDELEEDITGVPTMIIQPFIENSIEHGIKPQKNGKVTISFNYIDDYVFQCIIEDDGIGRVKSREMQEKSGYFQNHRSMGTGITLRRLEILEDVIKRPLPVKTIDLYDDNGAATGTRVEITLPILDMKKA
jgi:two-component system, LytTR family, sensor kinase